MTSNTNNTVEFYWVEKDMLEEDNLVYVNRLFSAFKKECIGKDLKTLKIVIKCDFASGTSESKQTEDMGDAFRMILTLRDIEDRLREDAVEEEYVCCVGCGMSVCKFEEEPPHKDDRDEAVCVECYGVLCEEDEELICGENNGGGCGSKGVKLDNGAILFICECGEEETLHECDYCGEGETQFCESCDQWLCDGCNGGVDFGEVCSSCREHITDDDTCKTCNELVLEVNICDTCNECCDPSRPSRCCECEEEE